MSRRTVALVIAIVLIAAASFVTYSVTKPPPKQVVQQPKNVLEQVQQPGGVQSTGQPSSANTKDEAKTAVTKFIVAVNNPDKPVGTVADHQGGMQYLAPELQKVVSGKLGGDPAKLLPGVRPSPFKIGNQSGDEKKKLLLVTFDPDRKPVTIEFKVIKADKAWLIRETHPK